MTQILPSQPSVSLGRIGYMNVAPIYFGLDNGLTPSWIRIVSSHPNTLNRMMAEGTLDISPVSAAAHARNMNEWLLLPDLAITSREKVLSVLLVSLHDLEDLNGRRILVTNESSSARDLCQLIFRWKGISPEFIIDAITSPSQLSEVTDAALIIGDKALSCNWKAYFPFVYDLGTLWWKLTGLPFVFAVWAVRKEFAMHSPHQVAEVLHLLRTSYQYGKEHLAVIAEQASSKLNINLETAHRYYQTLGYHLQASEKSGLEMFYKGLHQAGIIDGSVELEFFDETASA